MGAAAGAWADDEVCGIAVFVDHGQPHAAGEVGIRINRFDHAEGLPVEDADVGRAGGGSDDGIATAIEIEITDGDIDAVAVFRVEGEETAELVAREALEDAARADHRQCPARSPPRPCDRRWFHRRPR